MIDKVTNCLRPRRVPRCERQLILMQPEQLRAIARQLEQVAYEIRAATDGIEQCDLWVSDMQHCESIVESTDCLLRDLRSCGSDRSHSANEFAPDRVGRPRRTRRRRT